MDFLLEDTPAKRDFKGIWIPKEIWLDHDLSPAEKCLIAEINSLDQGDGAWASNKYYGEFIGRSKQRVADLLTSLRKRGYVKDVGFNQGGRRLLKVSTIISLEPVGGS